MDAKSLLIVYVDDFKRDALWAEIWKVIDMDPETVDGRFLDVPTKDCTVIICNVNSPGEVNPNSRFAPGSDQGIAMVRLCNELKRPQEGGDCGRR